MEEGGSFIFCVSDFLQAFSCAFQTMKEKGEYTDVSIKCKGRTFLAHRVVLVAGIPHFRKILSTQDSEISLDEIDAEVLESLINFAYEGKLRVSAEKILPMLLATTFFQLDKIHKACCEFSSKTLASSNDLDDAHIKLVPSDSNIRENFDEFCNTEEFLFLPYSSLKELISRNDLKVHSEEKVFEAVMRWVKIFPTERQHLLPYLLTKIRMANLTPDYLVEKVAAEEMIHSSEPCKHIVEEAKSYHLLPNKRSMFLSFNTDSRLYINTYRTSQSDSSTVNSREIVACGNAISTAPNQSASQVNVTATTTNYNVLNLYTCAYKNKDGVYAVCCTPLGTKVGYYDGENKKWDYFPAGTRFDDIVGVVVVNDKLYVFFPNAIETFHLRKREWIDKLPISDTIKGSGIVCHMGSIYIFGGFCCQSKIQHFNPQLKKWFPDEEMRTGRRKMGITSYLGKYICLTGGFTTSCCSSVEKYNPITKEWTEMPSMLLDRMDHGCASLNNKIYISGGCVNDIQLLSTAEVYDRVSNQWTCIAPPKVPRYFPSLVPWDGKLYAFGGMYKKETYFRGLEVYNPETDKWISDKWISDNFVLSLEKYPVVLKAVSTIMCSE